MRPAIRPPIRNSSLQRSHPLSKLKIGFTLFSGAALLTGCVTGPYSPPKEPQVLTESSQPREARNELREEPKPEKRKYPPPVVDLSIGPRGRNDNVDLTMDSPIVIPREVFEQ